MDCLDCNGSGLYVEEGHRYQNSKADMIRSNLVVALERTEAGKEFLKKL